MKNTFKTNDSQQKIGVEANVITKQISETETRTLITNKTRQSIKPYQSRDLRIKHKPGRVYKVEPKRGNFSLFSNTKQVKALTQSKEKL